MRMPWAEYKAIITKYLKDGMGKNEYNSLAASKRRDGESALQWALRLNKCKTENEKPESGIKLPDSIYGAFM